MGSQAYKQIVPIQVLRKTVKVFLVWSGRWWEGVIKSEWVREKIMRESGS